MDEIFGGLSTVFSLLMDQFTNTISTITSNDLLFVPILISFAGGLILAGVRICRKLGVRGLGGGRRRRRRG